MSAGVLLNLQDLLTAVSSVLAMASCIRPGS